MRNISEILFELRCEQGISQKQLADATGVSQSTIAKIEVNRNEATASTIRKLARYFNVSADYLLGMEDDFGAKIYCDERPVLTAEERELIINFKKLPPEYRNILCETVRLWNERHTDD